MSKSSEHFFIHFKGPMPRESQGTRITLKIDENQSEMQLQWSAKLIAVTTKNVTVRILVPSNAIIGTWNMLAETSRKTNSLIPAEKQAIHTYVYPTYGIYLLLNPWNESKATEIITWLSFVSEFIMNVFGSDRLSLNKIS